MNNHNFAFKFSFSVLIQKYLQYILVSVNSDRRNWFTSSGIRAFVGAICIKMALKERKNRLY